MITTFKKMVDDGLTNWTFNIVGQVQNQVYFEELYRMADKYPIKFHIGISFEKLQKLYSESMIYWHMTGITMPNEVGAQEHFGITIVEAMASGCVPICLGTGGVKEIIDDCSEGILVNDTEELNQETIALINNPKQIKEISRNAIERSKDFDEEITKKKFYSIITKTNKVSIIILCWNNSQITKDCVNRLYEVTPPGFELILVDNASTDNTWIVIKDLQKKYPNIKIIRNKTNLGFAKGNNIGLKSATKDYIL